MFVLSKHQFARLTAGIDRPWKRRDLPPSGGDQHTAEKSAATALLDLGAGDGRPTLAIAAGFDRVAVTEASRHMQKLLTDKVVVLGILKELRLLTSSTGLRSGCGASQTLWCNL